MKLATDAAGYQRFTFYNGGGLSSRRAVSVHRLVLLAFVGPCPPGCEADHVNRDRSDNRLVNLRWLPMPANRRRSNRRRALNSEAVKVMRYLRGRVTGRCLARLHSVSPSAVMLVQQGVNWH